LLSHPPAAATPRTSSRPSKCFLAPTMCRRSSWRASSHGEVPGARSDRGQSSPGDRM